MTNRKTQKGNRLEDITPDTFTIYQLKEGEDLRYHRFASLKRLLIDGLTVQYQNYDQIYTAPLEKDETLDNLYRRFNIGHPKDFTGHSLSVSDVVVLHWDGKDHAYYMDNFGFSEVPQFLEPQQTNALALQEVPFSMEIAVKYIQKIISNVQAADEKKKSGTTAFHINVMRLQRLYEKLPNDWPQHYW